ncbi:MAG TPA: hypothetical protein VN843_10970 [Anaerolineales bacterium]|nr:hypothetical protein [Anaerolineales bacterium]
MRKLSTIARWFLPVLLIGFYCTSIEAQQVLTNRTPDKAKIQPETKSQPTPTRDSDELIAPDPRIDPTGKPRPEKFEFESNPAYYIQMVGVGRVFVSDAKGRSDDLRARSIQQVEEAGYDFFRSHTVFITLPVGETYSITFEAQNPAMTLEIVKGKGNVSPDEAIRYNDLVLDKAKARFQVSATGVTSLQIDANHDGRFESILEPTAHVVGAAAKDTRGPEITFEVLQRDATSILIAIKAIDKQTGVKNLFYSIDKEYIFPYESPVRVNLSESNFIMGIADDNAGNRSSNTYKFDPRR